MKVVSNNHNHRLSVTHLLGHGCHVVGPCEAVIFVDACVGCCDWWLARNDVDNACCSETEADRCILQGTGAFARGVYLSKAEMMTPGLFQSCTIMDKLNEAEEHEHGSMKDDMGWH